MSLNKYYFTFGSHPDFPFGIKDYVLIMAKNEATARDLFGKHFPNPVHPDTLNFAFCYEEKEWEDIHNKYYPETSPSAIITDENGSRVFTPDDYGKENNIEEEDYER